jgi:hypothetical protein
MSLTNAFVTGYQIRLDVPYAKPECDHYQTQRRHHPHRLYRSLAQRYSQRDKKSEPRRDEEGRKDLGKPDQVVTLSCAINPPAQAPPPSRPSHPKRLQQSATEHLGANEKSRSNDLL